MIETLREELKFGVGRLELALAWLGLIASVTLGPVWTAQAVMAGSHVDVVVRFTVSVLGGLYYLVLIDRCQ